MPAVSSISSPSAYSTWNKVFFDDGPTATRVVTYNDPSSSTTHKIAWGKTSSGFYFFLRMTNAEESSFWSDHAAWRIANPGTHQYQAFSTLPPTCGTPNTPACPP